MKKYFFTTLSACSIITVAAQPPHARLQLQDVAARVWDIGFDHRVLAPMGDFAGMGRLKGYGIYGGTRFFNNRLQAQAVYSVISQPVLADKKQWVTEEGTISGQINQESWLFNTGLQARYNITDKRGLNPFVMAGGGQLQSLGKVRVYGKEEADCPLLAPAAVMRSQAPYGMLGGGVSWASGWFQNQGRAPQNIRLELAFHYLHSARMQLFNTRLQDAALPANATPVYVSFADGETGSLVRQRAGHLLEGRMRGWMFNITLMYGFGTVRKKEV